MKAQYNTILVEMGCGKTMEEIGARIGIHKSMVRKHLHAALVKMRKRNPRLRELLDALNERNMEPHRSLIEI